MHKQKIRSLVLQGNYKEALALAEKQLKQSPKDVHFEFTYAKILGDYADELPSSKKRAAKKKSIAIIKKLLPRISRETQDFRFSVRLNYYYQSERFQEMARYGAALRRKGYKRGAYAIGLGYSLLAQKLHTQKAPASKVRLVARKSIEGWERYTLGTEKYYFAHYSYALALALNGQNKLAIKSIRRAAKLSKRPTTDWEFQDVLLITQQTDFPSGP